MGNYIWFSRTSPHLSRVTLFARLWHCGLGMIVCRWIKSETAAQNNICFSKSDVQNQCVVCPRVSRSNACWEIMLWEKPREDRKFLSAGKTVEIYRLIIRDAAWLNNWYLCTCSWRVRWRQRTCTRKHTLIVAANKWTRCETEIHEKQQQLFIHLLLLMRLCLLLCLYLFKLFLFYVLYLWKGCCF